MYPIPHEIKVPNLPTMIGGKANINEEGDDVLTEYSYINNTFDCIDNDLTEKSRTKTNGKSHNLSKSSR